MAHESLMPKLGLTMTEGTVEEWKFKEGDTVKKVFAYQDKVQIKKNGILGWTYRSNLE